MEIVFRNTNKSFEVRNSKERLIALNDVSFSVTGKEFVCLLGPSGCGHGPRDFIPDANAVVWIGLIVLINYKIYR